MISWWKRFRRKRDWEKEENKEPEVNARIEYNRRLAAQKRLEKYREELQEKITAQKTKAKAFLEEEKEEAARRALLEREKLKVQEEETEREIEKTEEQLKELRILLEKEETFSRKSSERRNFHEEHRVKEEVPLNQKTLNFPAERVQSAVEQELEKLKQERRGK
ncbi:hypothetical protein [Alkalicoccus daliensis]|uniref:Phage shock protein A (PspA) family protein n=1 Tax=Alkalicoccus daliensis TaxID=745820 RepID=A0A1H0J385_9BACI|nr:hypothetical protein [Alkalicoccus daliensis]SDO38062.1 phage shock protein A (PspA) family protein [Alkalicoccus daliensis]